MGRLGHRSPVLMSLLLPFAEIEAGATSITLAIAVRITIVMDVAPAWTSANDKKCTLL